MSRILLQLIISLLLLALFIAGVATENQSAENFISLMTRSFVGTSISRWDTNSTLRRGASICNLFGISCDNAGDVVKLDISGWSLAGTFPSGVCAYLPKLRTLRVDHNDIRNGFPVDIVNCSFLQEVNMSFSGLSGKLPDLSPLHSLRFLDLSNNFFSGDFPLSVFNLTDIELINFNENPNFDVWRLPETVTRLTSLKVVILSTTCMRGEISTWIGNMTWLTDLELSGNLLTGEVPTTLGKLQNLRLLELYYNLLTGEIPRELGNLTLLEDIDMSVNQLTGGLPLELCQLPHLRVLQFYSNRLTGELPRSLGNSTALTLLSIYRNFFSGEVPPDLGRFSPLVLLELSENRFSGELPKGACAGSQLLYFLVLGNLFSGDLPESYATCWPVLRFRVNDNHLGGTVPLGIFSLSHVSIIDLGYNDFEGTIPKSIAGAKNLTGLFFQNNRISGTLPQEIALASNLVKIDASNNNLLGPIPSELGNLSKLNQLLLQGNKFDSFIPASLSSLKSLNLLNLSNNLLTGEIPESLCDLLPNSLDFSNNRLSGPVPLALIKRGLIASIAGNHALCVTVPMNISDSVLHLCPQNFLKKRLKNIWVLGVATMLSVIGVLILTKQYWLFRNKEAAKDQDGGLLSSPSFFNYDVTNFHKLNFEQHEILEALIEKNIVGRGGSGTVYKVELKGGEQVAVKKLWKKSTMTKKCYELMDRELRSEVETLGSIRHKNIVKLVCCFSSIDCNLLVYEFMPNGNLWDALHKSLNFLDWPARQRIAVGVAQGLSYLHHGLLFPIIHRDIKSSNVLLDADYEPKVADFGISKVLQARDGGGDSSTTAVVGTCGYMAPEYAYSFKATTKSDVYSFGVVLMELVTGKKPCEADFGENKDIVQWISMKMTSRQGAIEICDKRLKMEETMVQVLRVALRCTSSSPTLRPPMNEVVQLLMEVDTRGSSITVAKATSC